MAQYTYNPIKEEKDGQVARRQIWSTQSLDMAFEGLKQGKKLWANPFYEGNTKLLKADLNFQRTPEEEEEFIRCMNDILYFANKYCKLMTPEGIKTIKLRDYQERYLKHLQNNRLSIYLACRQCGKCLSLLTDVDIKLFDDRLKSKFNCYYILDEDIYKVPLFELQNLYDTSFKWKIKYQLYKLLNLLINEK